MITLAHLKTRLRITAPTYDGLLQSYIDAATAIIEDYCEQPITAQSVSVIFSHRYRCGRFAHVQGVLSVEGRDSMLTAWNPLDPDDWVFVAEADPPEILILHPHYLLHRAALQVGYSVAPLALQEVCYEMVKTMAQDDGIVGQQSTFRVTSITRENDRDRTITEFRDLASRHKEVLNRYRLRTV